MVKQGLLRFHWSTEVYGLGTCFREYALYPRFLPFFFTSDHGINISRNLDPDIASGRIGTRKHLTWTSSNLELEIPQVKLVGVIHPWLFYLKSQKNINPPSRKGSIFYPYHKVPGFDFLGLDDDSSIKYLLNLPKKYHPICVSLHMHDLGGDRQRKFEESGFQIVTLGQSDSEDYHQKFFGLVSKFAYAFSENWGSQVPFLILSGVPCQIIPRNVQILLKGEPASLHTEEYSQQSKKAEELFQNLPSEISGPQLEFANSTVGKTIGISRFRLVRLAYTELLVVGIPWLLHETFRHLRIKLERKNELNDHAS